MPGNRGRGLFLPRKHSTETRDITQSFREIERWANVTQINPFRYAANWADSGGVFIKGGSFLDPFGIVHLLGEVVFTGTILAGTASTITTLPPRYQPTALNTFFTSFGTAPIHPTLCQVLANGIVQVFVDTNAVNPSFSLCGFTYPVFQ